MSKLESEKFYEKMHLRRSVREFDTQSIDEIILLNAIRTAGTAPSGANKQPWYFALITSQDLKNRIRSAAEKVEGEFYSAKAPQSWLKDLEVFKTSHHKPYLTEAPALIAVFSRYLIESSSGQMERAYYPLESTGIAVGLLLTALHLSGLSTLTHTPRPMGFLNTELNLDASYRPFMIVVAGYPKKPMALPNICRKELDQILGRY